MTRRPRAVVYHRPRSRRRSPAVVVGLLGLSGLVAAQLAVLGALPDPSGLDRLPASLRALVGSGPRTPTPVAAGPTAAVPEQVDPAPAVGTVLPTAAPSVPAAGPDLRPVPTTTVRFEAGAVLDPDARAALEPVLAVLAAPDAAPVLLTGTAEPGVDVASSLLLAQQRADAVAAALVEGGAPAALLRTTGVVDPGAGRTVVLAPEVP